MKKMLLLLSVSLMFSCTKDWECCVTTTTSGLVGISSGQNGTSVNCIDFRGTNEEKNEYEALGTQVTNQILPGGFGVPTIEFTITQTTECVPD